MGVTPYRLELTVPGLPPMNTATTRRHWSVAHREAARWRDVLNILIAGKKSTDDRKKGRKKEIPEDKINYKGSKQQESC